MHGIPKILIRDNIYRSTVNLQICYTSAMFIIEIIPISRGISSESLSYFTSKQVAIGSIVDIPLRKKVVHGIVIGVTNANDIKGEIKNATFALKKIEGIKSTRLFNAGFMEMVKNVAEYYATSTGAVLDILLPKYILNNISKLKVNRVNENDRKNDRTVEKYAVQGDIDERYSTWKGLIRQEFANKKSILFILPTIEDVQYCFDRLSKGIEDYSFILHGSLTPKKVISTWNEIMVEEHPVFIVATGGFLSLPRNDIETIVLESENSRSYKIQRRPFLDIRNVCEIFAENNSKKIFFADSMLRIETLWKVNSNIYKQSSPFKFRSLGTAVDTIVDMKSYKNDEKEFRVISDELDNLILNNKNNSEQMVILAARRGISPSTTCGDCQTIVTCNKCSTPVVLHSKDDKNFFMCHRCGERRSAAEYCKNCGSWKLGSMGIGIDLVMNKIRREYPNISIWKIDSDSTKGDKSIKEIITKFYSKPGGILIGTEMMFPYLHTPVENSAIVSLDSLFALPDFRIQEKILYMLIRMRKLATKSFIVQTRKSDEKVFEYGLKGNMNDFYKNTISERENFNYPPFTTLIKITLEGKKDEIVKEMEEVQNILDPFEVEVFPAFTQTIRNNHVLHGLIRLPIDKWPSVELTEKIRSLPPDVTVKVDPDSLL